MISESGLLPQTQQSAVGAWQGLKAGFKAPPDAFRPVPFFWWVGGPLDRVKMEWQLDRLREKGVLQTVISYSHGPEGDCDRGDPALFSPEWWDFFRWFLDACKARQMTAGIQDYTICEPLLSEAGRETPDMEGGQLGCEWTRVSGGDTAVLEIDSGCRPVLVVAYPWLDGRASAGEAILLEHEPGSNRIEWQAPAGDWVLVFCFAWLAPFDPLHPESGALAIGKLYAPFERECPSHIGTTLNLFFQDELSFGGRMPFWSNRLFEVFQRRKGYDLKPVLPALWLDLGPVSEKVRMDYADAVSREIEERYFRPVFEWHDSRGIMLGHDNGGRGLIREGRSYYADYFRSMKWFSAPGCDDPKIQGPRAFKGLKVNSSIAHLYDRPRVWMEGFHSSGWGVTPADLIDAVYEDLVYGASVINLHGLYHSTQGGWWEWAAPDFHFRQPYWQHCNPLNDGFARLCWILTRGVHRCDVGIVYPIDAIDALPAEAGRARIVAHVGNAGIEGGYHEDPEECAFRLGRYLFDHGLDFDFLDRDSIAAARVEDGRLIAGSAGYRVVILPSMQALSHSNALKLLAFVERGGWVVAFGSLPEASDLAGREDGEFDALMTRIFGDVGGPSDHSKVHAGGGVAWWIHSDQERLLEYLATHLKPNLHSLSSFQMLHRKVDDVDIHFIRNPEDEEIAVDLRAEGPAVVEIWDPWTGQSSPVNSFPITLPGRAAKLLVIHRQPRVAMPVSQTAPVNLVGRVLDDEWECVIRPSLDNRFGDFRCPAAPGPIGPEARRFRWRDEHEHDDVGAWEKPGYDDSSWEMTTYSFGPQMEWSGPFPSGGDALEPVDPDAWKPYVFSRRWGIERDPFLVDWLSGPHGLKGEVPDTYLDFDGAPPGSFWLVRAVVIADAPGEHLLVAGGRCTHEVWLNGCRILEANEELEPGRFPPWGIPHYHCERREVRVNLQAGRNELLVNVVQPEGQRARCFVALDPQPVDPDALALRWFHANDSLQPRWLAPRTRRAVWFRFPSPPGMTGLVFAAKGPAQVWINGEPARVSGIGDSEGAVIRQQVLTDAPLLRAGVVVMRIAAPFDSHAGDVLPEPVAFSTARGLVRTGDWCEQGLATFSGALEYVREIEIPERSRHASVILDLGDVRATADVRVNGQAVATLLAPPWRCEIGRWLQPGGNRLSITVANTLSNHYSVGIPSPYAFPHQNPSGLLGPVRLWFDS